MTKKLTEFMTKVDYRTKTHEGNVCKKLAELEDKFNNKLKVYATRAMVKQDIEDMKKLVTTPLRQNLTQL